MRALNVDENVSLNDVINLRPCDAKQRYRLSEPVLIEIADKIGAKIKVGKRILLHRPKMDDYFESISC